jgi:tRNA(fMet)-specific endonuclease VapC
MKYLIDTNICIYIMNNHPTQVVQRFKSIGVGSVGISTVTVSELHYGACKSMYIEKNLKRLDEFLRPFEVLPYDENASKHYGLIRAELEKQGRVLGPLDLLIAAHALGNRLILVTNNEREFKRIKSLSVENWIEQGAS